MKDRGGNRRWFQFSRWPRANHVGAQELRRSPKQDAARPRPQANRSSSDQSHISATICSSRLSIHLRVSSRSQYFLRSVELVTSASGSTCSTRKICHNYLGLDKTAESR